LLEYGNRLLGVQSGTENPTLGELVDTPLQDIRILILETFGDALIESKSVEEMGEKFRQKVINL
jgi:hypothetical protein